MKWEIDFEHCSNDGSKTGWEVNWKLIQETRQCIFPTFWYILTLQSALCFYCDSNPGQVCVNSKRHILFPSRNILLHCCAYPHNLGVPWYTTITPANWYPHSISVPCCMGFPGWVFYFPPLKFPNLPRVFQAALLSTGWEGAIRS